MVRKKLPNSISTEELLDLLEKPELQRKTSEVENVIDFGKNDIFRFFSTFDIKPGREKITNTLLYSLYNKWSENPVSISGFVNSAKIYLDYTYNDRKALMFFLDSNYFKIISKTKEIFNNKGEVKRHPFQRQFEKFLSAHKISSGSNYIPSYVIYFLYDSWVFDTRKRGQLKYKAFRKFIKLYVTYKITPQEILYIGINDQATKEIFTDEFIKKGTAWAKAYLLENQQKKPDKVPSSRSKIESKT